LRWLAEILVFPIATLMPRPIAPGVFGIARTIADPGSDRSRKSIVRPAMIDNTRVEFPT
jgi:hypothetical protein